MKKSSLLKLRDPNAKAMWGKTKSQTFRDRSKYTRKKKHKNRED